MKRNFALDFIRRNSKLVTLIHANPIKKEEMYDSYQPIYFEQRLGNNGTAFILQDMGTRGWNLYFIQPENDVTKSLAAFCTITACEDSTI